MTRVERSKKVALITQRYLAAVAGIIEDLIDKIRAGFEQCAGCLHLGCGPGDSPGNYGL